MNDTDDSSPPASDVAFALEAVRLNVSRTGLWLRGTVRAAIGRLARHARESGLGQEARRHLSPVTVQWRDSAPRDLSPALVEATQRISVDAARMTHSAVNELLEEGIHPGEYVETVAVVAGVTALDTFHRGMGYELPPILPGDTSPPKRIEPAGSVDDPDVCWLPTVPPEAASGDLAAWYRRGFSVGNLYRTLTYSPRDAITFFNLQRPMYAEGEDLWDFANSPLALDRVSVEAIATRVSVLNECFY